MFDPTSAVVLGPDQGAAVDFEGLGSRFMIRGTDSGGAFALIEHTIEPRALAAPLHVHRNEDEYSYVTAGEVGVQVGAEIHYARPGDLVFKPRDVPHAFWNRGDEPARLLEIVSPAEFEAYFVEIAPLLPPNRPDPDFEGLAEVMARYGLEMDMESIATISEREGLPVPAP